MIAIDIPASAASRVSPEARREEMREWVLGGLGVGDVVRAAVKTWSIRPGRAKADLAIIHAEFRKEAEEADPVADLQISVNQRGRLLFNALQRHDRAKEERQRERFAWLAGRLYCDRERAVRELKKLLDAPLRRRKKKGEKEPEEPLTTPWGTPAALAGGPLAGPGSPGGAVISALKGPILTLGPAEEGTFFKPKDPAPAPDLHPVFSQTNATALDETIAAAPDPAAVAADPSQFDPEQLYAAALRMAAETNRGAPQGLEPPPSILRQMAEAACLTPNPGAHEARTAPASSAYEASTAPAPDAEIAAVEALEAEVHGFLANNRPMSFEEFRAVRAGHRPGVCHVPLSVAPKERCTK
jgi:hypothetical protein